MNRTVTASLISTPPPEGPAVYLLAADGPPNGCDEDGKTADRNNRVDGAKACDGQVRLNDEVVACNGQERGWRAFAARPTMISLSMKAVSCIALLLVSSGCASTRPDTKPTSQATNNTAEQNKGIARALIRSEYSQWDDDHQFRCLDKLWQAESHWNHRARNKRTGACGIPQSYPCHKMSGWGKVYGVNYRTNPWPQIAWGLQYIDKRYGTPCAAWKRFQRGGGY